MYENSIFKDRKYNNIIMGITEISKDSHSPLFHELPPKNSLFESIQELFFRSNSLIVGLILICPGGGSRLTNHCKLHFSASTSLSIQVKLTQISFCLSSADPPPLRNGTLELEHFHLCREKFEIIKSFKTISQNPVF